MCTQCPACESERVYWLLHRVNGRGVRASQRSVRWGCRGCGHQWEAPLEPLEATPPPLPSPG